MSKTIVIHGHVVDLVSEFDAGGYRGTVTVAEPKVPGKDGGPFRTETVHVTREDAVGWTGCLVGRAENAMNGVIGFALVMASLAIYLTPFIVAAAREHRDVGAIFVLSFLAD
jgi:hypothetical protein